jgi:hypothetical protein
VGDNRIELTTGIVRREWDDKIEIDFKAIGWLELTITHVVL